PRLGRRVDPRADGRGCTASSRGRVPPMSTVEDTSSAVDLDRLSIDTIRVLSMDAVQHANSGHPGLPMGLAPLGYLLFTKYLRHNPADPSWPDRDRFVLSAGHGSMLLYGLLHLTGYALSMDDLKSF